jgi:hypothetical protein
MKDNIAFFQNKIGLEIGGLSSVFRKDGLLPIYAVAERVDNCIFSNYTIWTCANGEIKEGATYNYDSQHGFGNQYIVEATDLNCISSDSYDFILSSHVLEHIANPLLALSEWIRVLKDNGLLVLVVPHKGFTFDHCRPVTTLQHIIKDFEQQKTEEDYLHLEEILRLHDLTKDPGAGSFQNFQQRSKENSKNRCLHHHVFDSNLARDIISYVGLQILTVKFENPFHIFVIAKKMA